ncbi:lipase family protein [Alkalimonas collagenimarina]|uniref:Lipase family protein n=1 Tax=Alkalimonas collagenimarina TaxID=400390 RepID=A0ABT9GV44_9GAMM|nr:lipase family protein [Alkalimonas collagenimarina]MDP4534898.1 lipase family protein [Alkalimonas collagenimarina]
MLNRRTGFAVVGQGKNQYQGDTVVAIRGTFMKLKWNKLELRDVVTDLHFGLATGDNQTRIHAGFNKVFQSIKPALSEQLNPLLRANGKGTVHCVGHSLGGALAHLTADWVKRQYGNRVCLYTFGAPRVGLTEFAKKTTTSIDKHFRCIHSSDPVPMVPLWPFIHAPFNKQEFVLAPGSMINPFHHSMAGSPGYINTANSHSWQQLTQNTRTNSQPVVLRYADRYRASFTTYWALRITDALITILKKAGQLAAIMTAATIGTALTFYDLLAHSMEQIAKAAPEFAEDIKGLLGHMLVFAGKVTTTITDLTARFIRWVFDVTVGALYRAVRQAMKNLE